MTVRWIKDELSGTTWPVDVSSEAEDSTQWILRYAPGRNETTFATAASVLSAYAALIDPSRTQGEAVEMLKRARRCAASVCRETETP